MTKDERDYLRSLVRMDIRKKERQLAKFAPKPGQPEDQAFAFRLKQEHGMRFRQDLLTKLDTLVPDETVILSPDEKRQIKTMLKTARGG